MPVSHDLRITVKTKTRTMNAIIRVRGIFGEHAIKDDKTIIRELILRHMADFELDNTSDKSDHVSLTKEVAQCR